MQQNSKENPQASMHRNLPIFPQETFGENGGETIYTLCLTTSCCGSGSEFSFWWIRLVFTILFFKNIFLILIFYIRIPWYWSSVIVWFNMMSLVSVSCWLSRTGQPANCPKNNLNLCIKTEPVTVRADALVNVCFLGQIYCMLTKARHA